MMSRVVLVRALLALAPTATAPLPVPRPLAGAPTIAAAVAPYDFVRFRGPARNGNYTGIFTLDLAVTDPATRKVVGLVKASDGLYGQGVLTGTLAGGTLNVKGTLRYEMPAQGSTLKLRGAFTMTVQAQLGANNVLAGSFDLEGIGSGGTQHGTFTLSPTGRTPAVAVDPSLVGIWAMLVPGGAWSEEWDRGSFIERVNHVSVGAPAGALVISADGSYQWRKKSGTTTGRLVPYEPTSGGTGFLVHFEDEWFYAQYLTGRNGGFYLFSPATEYTVYEGRAVK